MHGNGDGHQIPGTIGPSQSEIKDTISIVRTELQDSLGRSFAFVGGAAGQLENIHEALQVLKTNDRNTLRSKVA